MLKQKTWEKEKNIREFQKITIFESFTSLTSVMQCLAQIRCLKKYLWSALTSI